MRIIALVIVIWLSMVPFASAEGSRFEIFNTSVVVSGMGTERMELGILLDTTTGRTWVLSQPEKGNLEWHQLTFSEQPVKGLKEPYSKE